MPQIEGATGRFMLQQMVAVAELEAGLISARTKAALAAAKARGKSLGGRRVRTSDGKPVTISREAQKKGAAALRKRAADLAPTIAETRKSGAATLQAIANALNDAGIQTPRGRGKWTPTQVQRTLIILMDNGLRPHPDGAPVAFAEEACHRALPLSLLSRRKRVDRRAQPRYAARIELGGTNVSTNCFCNGGCILHQ
jgi:hypothetical protein